MRKFTVFISILFYTVNIYAQPKISRLTHVIVDTTASKTEQAHQIYTWITNNVAYDTKLFENDNAIIFYKKIRKNSMNWLSWIRKIKNHNF